MISFLLEIPINKTLPSSVEILFLQKPKSLNLQFCNEHVEFYCWGDPIITEEISDVDLRYSNIINILEKISGHFYYLAMDKIKRAIVFGNSLFSILPIYYREYNTRLLLSDNAFTISKYTGNAILSNLYLFEFILFNYPISETSIIEDVNLLSSNSFFHISTKGFRIRKHTNIEDYFQLSSHSRRDVVEMITDKLIATSEKYLPTDSYVTSLTGGFDGRTLVSISNFYDRKFSCYCFGSEDSHDLILAKEICEKIGFPFIEVLLNENYANYHNYPDGKEFIQNASGQATHSRAHYLFAAKSLGLNFKYMISGNFGSEIFRAAHIAGVMISQNIYNLFTESTLTEAYKSIERSQEFKLLGNLYKNEWQEIKETISMRFRFPKQDSRNINSDFYKFVFEEVFRKYFGAEMVNQYKYIINRTPFLDWEFLKLILSTNYAGVHSNFRERNPILRRKGQIIYANAIKKTLPQLNNIITEKGYKPKDLLLPFGIIPIGVSYIQKRIRRSNSISDPNYVSRSWMNNYNLWLSENYSNYFPEIDIESSSSLEVKLKLSSINSLIYSNELCLRK